MKLKQLLQGIQVTAVCADPEQEVTGISIDSRTTAAGEVFVAIPGTREDGSDYSEQALGRGAVCVVCQQPLRSGGAYVCVASCRRTLALMAANFYGHPDREMTMVGITGTNGKTTSAWLIRRILEEQAGARVGVIGTIENGVGTDAEAAERTTPQPPELQRLLRRMADQGCSHVVMEVSSHALALDRVYGIRFAVGLFTNLTQDHLDYHGTMERYCAAKARLMRSCDAAVYNGDDAWSAQILQGSTCRRYAYGMGRSCDLRAEAVSCADDHVAFRACTAWEQVEMRCAIPGMFSVYNALAASAVCSQLGVPLTKCAQILRSEHGARGRMEVAAVPDAGYTVLIDYAHTPDALENVLGAVRGFARGRTIAVFGCGGDRDRTKRPQMGAIAARLADVAVVTTDNPRSEEPADIIHDILAGMPPDSAVVVEDRAEAIAWAMAHAQKNDVIVLCGKGHETYQEVDGVKRHLDEREIVAEYLRRHGGQ